MHFSSSKTGKKYQRNILSSNSSLRTSWKNTLEIIHVCDKKEPRLLFLVSFLNIVVFSTGKAMRVLPCTNVLMLCYWCCWTFDYCCLWEWLSCFSILLIMALMFSVKHKIFLNGIIISNYIDDFIDIFSLILIVFSQ